MIGRAVFHLFGDDPLGQRPPGLDTRSVPVIVIAGVQGHLLHQVVWRDSLHAIAQQYGSDVRRLTGDHLLVVIKKSSRRRTKSGGGTSV